MVTELEEARARIVLEVAAWARTRSLPQLLNELNNASAPTDDLHVSSKNVNFTPVNKVPYRLTEASRAPTFTCPLTTGLYPCVFLSHRRTSVRC